MMRSERMCQILREKDGLKNSKSCADTHYRGEQARDPNLNRRKIVSIRKRKFQVVRCPGDGMCFYHAVATAMNALLHARDHTGLEIYSKTARIDPTVRRTWAEDTDVSKTAEALSLNINVWEGHNRMWINHGRDDVPRIYLYNPHNVHFDALIPLFV